jgi:putative transposase
MPPWGCGALQDCRYLLHDRDTKYTLSFRAIITSGGVKPLALPAHSLNLNAYAERWVRSVKEDCLSKIILLGEGSLRRALGEYVEHYHAERNHQGRGNVLLFPRLVVGHRTRNVQCRQRLGGLLRLYEAPRVKGVFRRFLQFVYVADWAAHVSGDLHSWQR